MRTYYSYQATGATSHLPMFLALLHILYLLPICLSHTYCYLTKTHMPDLSPLQSTSDTPCLTYCSHPPYHTQNCHHLLHLWCVSPTARFLKTRYQRNYRRCNPFYLYWSQLRSRLANCASYMSPK